MKGLSSRYTRATSIIISQRLRLPVLDQQKSGPINSQSPMRVEPGEPLPLLAVLWAKKMNSGRSRVNGATQTPKNTSKVMVQQMVQVKPISHRLAGEREVEKDGRREEKIGVGVIRIHYT